MNPTKLMRAVNTLLFAIFLFCLGTTGCKQEVENFTTDSLSSFLLYKPGKYIIYRLDSTVFPDNGRSEVIHSYLQKDSVGKEFSDNLGRASYTIYRFIRDTDQKNPWTPIGTYFITPQRNTVEVTENNMRIIQLASPIREGASWKGNTYLPANPYQASYSFGNDTYIKDWNFTINSVNTSLTVNGKNIPDVLIVTRINVKDVPDTIEVTNNSVAIPSNDSTVWIRGSASGNITINAAAPSTKNFLMTVYNRSNFPAKLNSISIPVNMGRTFEYVNNEWTFGSKNAQGNRLDTVYADVPFSNRTYAVDKFARNIGLVEQELILWEYQPNQNGAGSTPYKTGFGVKRSMIEHN